MNYDQKELLFKKILYRATYRGGKEADFIFKNFAHQFMKTLSDQELCDFNLLLQEDDSLIFSWLANIEEVPLSFNTPLLTQLRHYFNSLRY